ncbi:Lung seven transmembrane receptor family protein [Zea mays]|uniref:Lung seven transmembrane receptor family protein n=1 Tax=Zea mays TaxID=4577 RepID=A0A1D6K217_MAIZE|nr:Lung seven transmembrane receptor family protein [Zea mays]
MLSLGLLLSDHKTSPRIFTDLAPFLNFASYLLINPVLMTPICLLHICILNFTTHLSSTH